jgi:hypothetical protein
MQRLGLSAHQHVSAALDQIAGAAVLVAIAQAVGWQIMDQAVWLRATATQVFASQHWEMPAFIADAPGAARGDLYVGRTGLRRADSYMRASLAFMGELSPNRDCGCIVCWENIIMTGSAAVRAA